MPIRVTIVEDSQEVREGLAWLFRNSTGFDCVGAYDTGEDAVQKVPRLKPDVVLMDIGLPGISGIECIVRLRRLCPTVQIVMLSVFEDEDRIFRSLAAGATGYLLKKTPPTGILEAVKELHAGGSPMSSQIARKVLKAFLSRGGNREAAAPQEDKVLEAENTDQLCPRERQILELLAKGYRYKEIADELNVTIHTVRTFIRRMYEKLHVHSRTEALLKVSP
jgi:DNA-binding NarL/FixJ family response regulator